jgi:hypothetical protein
VSIHLPDKVKQAYQDKAKIENRSLANMLEVVLTEALRQELHFD